MKLKVWTRAYRPFIMGGDVHTPIATEVEVDDVCDLGCELQGYLITSPTGHTFVAEATTGAFVGDTIEGVRNDLQVADPEIVRQQIIDSSKQASRATCVPAADFWRLFK